MLNFRLATQADSPDIFSWRNDAHTRSMALTTDVIDPSIHEAWFAATLENPSRVMVMAEHSSNGRTLSIAIIRFDVTGDEALVSINMNPAARGRGFATSSLLGAEQFLPGGHGLTLIAEIKPENIASFRAFERAGYQKAPASADIQGETVRYRKHFAAAASTIPRVSAYLE